MSNLEQLNKIFWEALDIKDIDSINDEMGPDQIEAWDSLAHVQLVCLLEEKFEISLDVIDISRMYSIGDVKKILKKYGVEV